jgi:hypothetical protein
MATYAARGLHPSLGFLAAWAYAMVGWLIPPLVLLQLGFTTAGTLHSAISGYPVNLWPQHVLGIHHQVHAIRLPRIVRRCSRLGVQHPRLRRIRGRRAAG